MLLFAFAALILMACTLICAVVCVFNFDHGLREVLDEKSYKRNTHFEALSGRTDRSYSPDHRLSLE
jgi:cell division protein FtsL